MNTTCPECHAVYEFKKPTRNTRVTCKRCHTVFLTPVEYLNLKNRDDSKTVRKRLKNEVQKENQQLRQHYQKVSRQFKEDKLKKAKKKLKQNENDAYRVEKPLIRKLLTSVLLIYLVVPYK